MPAISKINPTAPVTATQKATGVFEAPSSSPWFSANWPDTVPKELKVPAIPLDRILSERANETPNADAIWFLGHTVKYKELNEMVDQAASGLYELGLRKGDVLAILLPNSFQYVISYFAGLRIGVIVTGVNPTYKPNELLHQMKICGARALIYLDALYASSVEPVVDQLSLKFSVSTNIVDLAGLNPIKRRLGTWLGKIPTGKVNSKSIPFTDLMKSTSAVPHVEVKPEDTAIYLMTGGTTGVPKAAVITHVNCVANVQQCRLWMDRLSEGVTLLGVLPLFHAFAMTGVMNLSIRSGARMLLFAKPPDTKDLLKHIKTYCPDNSVVYLGAEILFKRLSEFPDIGNFDINKKILFAVSGAGPLHRPVQEKFEAQTKAPIVEGYGLSEATPVVSCGPLFSKRVVGSIGLPLPGTTWKIVDPASPTVDRKIFDGGPDAHPDPTIHVGELAVSGPQVMKGYLNAPDENANTLVVQDGVTWLLTGDIGYMDSQGFVRLLDRKKELIKVSGYSVFPKEVEELVHAHPSVNEVAVAGVKDREGTERVKAWIVLKPEFVGKVTESEILKWAGEHLTHYKAPKLIEFVDQIPKNAIGKVLRRELQAREKA